MHEFKINLKMMVERMQDKRGTKILLVRLNLKPLGYRTRVISTVSSHIFLFDRNFCPNKMFTRHSLVPLYKITNKKVELSLHPIFTHQTELKRLEHHYLLVQIPGSDKNVTSQKLGETFIEFELVSDLATQLLVHGLTAVNKRSELKVVWI